MKFGGTGVCVMCSFELPLQLTMIETLCSFCNNHPHWLYLYRESDHMITFLNCWLSFFDFFTDFFLVDFFLPFPVSLLCFFLCWVLLDFFEVLAGDLSTPEHKVYNICRAVSRVHWPTLFIAARVAGARTAVAVWIGTIAFLWWILSLIAVTSFFTVSVIKL